MKQAPLAQKKIEITSNTNNKYSVQIFNESNYLNIFIKAIDKIPSNTYYNKFSLEDIKQLNKYFHSCTNISEVLILIEPSLQNLNNISLIEETNGINLIVNISFPLSPQIIFKVQAMTKNINETINELYKIINKQNNIINEQKNEILLLRNEIKEKSIGIIEKNNILFDVYNKEQFKENNYCWYDILIKKVCKKK